MAYQLEGRLLEVCNCNVLCPCWVGEDPDGGTCDAIVAYHIDDGQIEGVDVSGLTLAILNHIPGNILQGNWRVLLCIDVRATPEQQDRLLQLFSGKLGGPVADLARLIGEIVGIERVPITFTVEGGQGRIQIGSYGQAELAPFRGMAGQPTALHDSIFSTIPGSPAYVGKAALFELDAPHYGFQLSLSDHNAVQGHFRFEA
jgi:hypothetical protein